LWHWMILFNAWLWKRVLTDFSRNRLPQRRQVPKRNLWLPFTIFDLSALKIQFLISFFCELCLCHPVFWQASIAHVIHTFRHLEIIFMHFVAKRLYWAIFPVLQQLNIYRINTYNIWYALSYWHTTITNVYKQQNSECRIGLVKSTGNDNLNLNRNCIPCIVMGRNSAAPW
jgi:hypothetical protein